MSLLRLRPVRIRWRLPLAFALGTLIFAGLVALVSAVLLREAFLDRLEDDMSQQAHQLEVVLSRLAGGSNGADAEDSGTGRPSTQQSSRPETSNNETLLSLQTVQELLRETGQAAHARFTLIDKEGWVLADSDAEPQTLENHANRPEVKRALAGHEARERRRSATLGYEEVYVAVPLPENTTAWSQGVLRVAQPASRVDSMVAATWRIPLLVWAALLLPMLVAAYLISRSIVQPLERLRLMTARVAAGDFSQRTTLRREDELGELAASLNSMAASLETREQELRTETERSAHMLESMSEGVLLMDKDGRLLQANSAAEALLGSELQAAVGRPLVLAARFFPAQTLAARAWEASEAVTETVENFDGRALVVEVVPLGNTAESAQEGRQRESEHADVAKIAAPLPGQTLFVFRDETERRNLERMRRDFVANVSHELKTPVAGISLLADTLAHTVLEDPDQALVFVEKLKTEAKRLNDLTADLLTLSCLEETPVADAAFAPIDLAALVCETVEEVRPLAASKSHQLTLDLPGVLPAEGDAANLRTLVRNLLDNAIRYTEPGGHIDVRLHIQEEPPGRRWAVLSVQDDGIGIPLAEQQRVFERFYRVDKARSRQTGGTGLGLSIVRHVAERHGGRVELKSTVGVGSTFTVFLPLR